MCALLTRDISDGSVGGVCGVGGGADLGLHLIVGRRISRLDAASAETTSCYGWMRRSRLKRRKWGGTGRKRKGRGERKWVEEDGGRGKERA